MRTTSLAFLNIISNFPVSNNCLCVITNINVSVPDTGEAIKPETK